MFGGWPGEEPPYPPKLKKRVQGGNGDRAAAESLEEQMYKWQGSSVSSLFLAARGLLVTLVRRRL